jgi:transcriptional regulator with XRE-family HTH domain
MPGRANELIVIPDSLWERPETAEALRRRDIGRFFALLRQYAGASQTQIAIACGMTQGKVSDIMRGSQQVEKLALFERIADGLGLPDQARTALGLAPRGPATPARDTAPALETASISSLLNAVSSQEEQEEDDPVRRRTFVGLAGASLFGAMLGEAKSIRPTADAESLAPVLTNPGGIGASVGQAPDIAALTAAVNQARQQYQACQYTTLTRYLPDLLARLNAACTVLDGEDRLKACALSADAEHVAGGLLLKLDDRGLAYLAADRSMRAAQASEDPVTIAGSARIVTHTLMSGHHLASAVTTASAHAARLDHDIDAHTPESLSVYGALLLRGAVAAAQDDQRATAHELLDEADIAARRLGIDGNIRWTAFGPVNAQLHRVSIAVTLGDAGTAVDVARRVNLDAIEVTERKATLLIDTARAFLQWGRHEKAYIALRAAEETAPEEVAGRPSVHRVVRDLVTAAPPSIRRDAEQFATQLGVQR